VKGYFVIICLFIFGSNGFGQGFYFGPKGGPVLGFQTWDAQQKRPLLGYQGDLLIETLDEQGNGALYAMIGYHQRGSSTGGFFAGTNIRTNRRFLWHNAVLSVGAKKKLNFGGSIVPYYLIGLRLEYTFATNLQNNFNGGRDFFFIVDERTNKINYGVTAGGGFEFPLNEFVIPYIEFTFNPDLSFQYKAESFGTIEGYFPGSLITIPEREIRNLSLEISIGFKFMRKVIYTN